MANMIIPFNAIYTKAIGLFDDPKITVAYNSNLMQFYKLMYTFLQNSISLFNNPLSVVRRLSIYSEPKGTMEVFISDGTQTTFTLDDSFEILDNSIYQYIINGKVAKGTLDKINRTVTFIGITPGVANQECSIEQYSIGSFEFDLSTLALDAGTTAAIVNQIKDILARLLIKSWGENTRNFLLDIQNILTDTDFKLHPASQALRSKDEWINSLDGEVLQYQNKLAWNIKMSKVV